MKIITEKQLIATVSEYVDGCGVYTICAATGLAPRTVQTFGTRNHGLNEVKKMAGFFNVRVILIPTSE